MFFNHAAIYEMPHMILAAYMVTGFTVAGVYAAGILRGRRDRYHYTGFALGFVPAAVLTPFQIFVGDTAARAIAHDQPVKFASMEYVARTSANVPEWLGGVYVNGHVYAGLKIPDMDSLLVGFGTGTKVTGWDSVPASRPAAGGVADPPVLRRDGRAWGSCCCWRGCGRLYEWWRHRRLPPQRLFWLLGTVSGVAAIVAMECGWVVTEVGRQPWVVYQLQTTAAAATTNGGVIASLTLVIVLYAVLGAATILILRLLARRWRRTGAQEAAVPYGPPPGPQDQALGRARVMIAAAAVGAILLASVSLYAVLGGADFGGGLWDLLAGGDQRGRAPRQLIDESITPVWEANHVWLVFDLVIFWTAFPHAFAAVMTVAALPLWLALAGIVLRGAGFAFRKEVRRLSLQRVARRDVRLLLAADPVLHGHRDRRHRDRAASPPTPAMPACPPGPARRRC